MTKQTNGVLFVLFTLLYFLASLFFVATSSLIIPRLRDSHWFGVALDRVNVATLGLMTGVTLQLAQAALVDLLTIGVAFVSAVLLFQFQTNSTGRIADGAAIGVLSALWREASPTVRGQML